jgi:hypothetical protein
MGMMGFNLKVSTQIHNGWKGILTLDQNKHNNAGLERESAIKGERDGIAKECVCVGFYKVAITNPIW